jgi:hypothetical protein
VEENLLGVTASGFDENIGRAEMREDYRIAKCGHDIDEGTLLQRQQRNDVIANVAIFLTIEKIATPGNPTRTGD